MPDPRRRTGARLLLLGLSLLVALGAAEVLLRCLPAPGPPPGQLFYQDQDRQETDPERAAAQGLIEAVEPSPRPRQRFAPGARFYICYRDQDRLRRSWLDEQGCVEVAINRWGLREREELGPDKPQGQRRLLCIGDSFTFGWGIPVEQNWVRLLETDLRRDRDEVRTVNCGAAGAIVVDEYWWGLRDRFAVLQPDAVLVTLCLNDLLPSSGLCLTGPPPEATFSRLLDRLLALGGPGPLDLDPALDWVSLLLQLPEGEGTAAGLYGHDKPFDAMWSQQGPQRALAAMHAWCRERGLVLMVALWPFLQGLGPGRHYPFARMHELVAGYCQQEDLPFLDLLPLLKPHAAEDLWVTPADLHPNPTAQRLVLPAFAEFVRRHWPP